MSRQTKTQLLLCIENLELREREINRELIALASDKSALERDNHALRRECARLQEMAKRRNRRYDALALENKELAGKVIVLRRLQTKNRNSMLGIYMLCALVAALIALKFT
jgi:hypothetical protein